MKNTPDYIGLVGINNIDDAVCCAESVNRNLEGITSHFHEAQIGVAVTDVTLAGAESRRDPALELIPRIFESVLEKRDRIFTVIHFSSRNSEQLEHNIDRLMETRNMYEENLCHGLQVNFTLGRIPKEVFQRIRTKYPNLGLILPVHADDNIASDLTDYGNFVDYAFVDESHGKGKTMNVSACSKTGKLIMRETKLKPAFAGGLSPKNVANTVQQLKTGLGTPKFSIDAESGLRSGERKISVFSPQKAEQFFREAISGFYTEM